MRKAILLTCLFIAISICACSPAQGRNPADAIEITYETGPEIHETERLEFWIKNTSRNCIVFPYNYGLKVFIERNEGWIEIPDLTEYPVKQDIHLQPAGDIFSENIVGVWPDLSKIQLQGPTNFRAVLNGRLCDNKNVVIEKIVPFTVVP